VAERFLCDNPTPEELERLLEALPTPPAQKLETLRQDFALAQTPMAAPASLEWPPLLQEVQAKADVRYADPPTSERPVVGPALILAKRAFRLVGQPFINEALRKQVEFNQAIIAGVGQLYETLQQHVRNQGLWRAEVEARLQHLEREQQEAASSHRERAEEGPEPETGPERPPPPVRARASKRPRKR